MSDDTEKVSVDLDREIYEVLELEAELYDETINETIDRLLDKGWISTGDR